MVSPTPTNIKAAALPIFSALIVAGFLLAAINIPPTSAEPVDQTDAIAEKYLPDAIDEAARPAVPTGFVSRLDRFMGKLHVVALHFPIVLLLMAAVTGPWLGSGYPYVVYAGALSTAITASFGWAAARWSQFPAEMTEALFWHRWLGTTGAGAAIAGAVLLLLSSSRRSLLIYSKIIIFIAAILVAIASFWGGHLVFGGDYLSW